MFSWQQDGDIARGDHRLACLHISCLRLVPEESPPRQAASRSKAKPAYVTVHKNVGIAALGQSLHNASGSRVPILSIAGLAPVRTPGQ